MSELLTSIGSVFTAVMGWMGDVASTVASTPLLLVGTILGIGGIAISYFKRLV